MFEINYKCYYKKNFSLLPKLRETRRPCSSPFQTQSIEGVLTFSSSLVVSLFLESIETKQLDLQ